MQTGSGRDGCPLHRGGGQKLSDGNPGGHRRPERGGSSDLETDAHAADVPDARVHHRGRHRPGKDERLHCRRGQRRGRRYLRPWRVSAVGQQNDPGTAGPYH